MVGLAVAIGAFVTSDASAAQWVKLGYGSQHFGNGGEFAFTASTTGTPAEKNASLQFVKDTAANYGPNSKIGSLAAGTIGFETFCIEYNEHFSPGTNYQYQVNPLGAIKGGQAISDSISVGTAFLYGLFAKGTLPGYNYTDVNAFSAGNLQNTIWFLESEQVSLPNGNFINNPGTFTALLTAEFGSNPVVWRGDSATSVSYGIVNAASFGVAAMNLGGGPTWPNQDQLIYQGGGFQKIPDGGATLILLGMTMTGLTFLRRKLS